jgi:hypothetical protein
MHEFRCELIAAASKGPGRGIIAGVYTWRTDRRDGDIDAGFVQEGER